MIPLYAKALDYRSKHSILHDRRAEELVQSIDFDFERLRSPGNPRVLAVRAWQYDVWIREFLAARPRSLVLNLGCGLDTRIARIGPPASALWIDLDFPEVIELRRNFFSELDGYRMLGASLTDPDWLGNVPADRPVLAVADGVFEYLSEDGVRSVVGRLTERFAHGEVAFDVMNSYALNLGNARLQGKTEARLRFAVDDLRRVDAFVPTWRRTTTVSVLASRVLPFWYRLIYALAYLSPNLRNTIRMVRYEF